MAAFVAILILFSVQQFVTSEVYPVPQNIDIDEILKNERLLRNYVDCILERGKCTAEGEQLKKGIPESLENECAKCNDAHKEGIRKVVHYLIKEKPKWWKELENKYDSKGIYKKRYNGYLEKEGLA